MDNININTISLILSFLAVFISSFFAIRQVKVMQQTNYLPILIDMFREFRDSDFKTHSSYVVNQLKKECNPAETGYMYLPPDALVHVRTISHFYDNLGLLVANGIIDQKLVLSFMGGSILSTWTVLEPFIRRERELRQGDYQEFFEHLAALAKKTSPDTIRRNMNLERVTLDPLKIEVKEPITNKEQVEGS